jgi:hypothetical protein
MQSEVADVLRKVGSKIESYGLNTCNFVRFMPLKCRTAELGGHIDACDDCGNITIVTTLAATGIVPNVRATNAKIGSRLEKQNSCQCHTSTWFYLADSINSLAIHQPKLVYDTLLKRHGNTKIFGKAKEMQME